MASARARVGATVSVALALTLLAFYRGIKHYLEANRGKNVVTADFAKAIGQTEVPSTTELLEPSVQTRPGRSDELSGAVSALCEDLQQQLRAGSHEAVEQQLQGEGFSLAVAQQLVAYLAAVLDALGCIPTRQQMVLQ